ncbi:unnamed protein product [Peniophora sp. CBMAI 1063]|nr:unnamed protein product [Peniophora sp. CBMAI 1063]
MHNEDNTKQHTRGRGHGRGYGGFGNNKNSRKTNESQDNHFLSYMAHLDTIPELCVSSTPQRTLTLEDHFYSILSKTVKLAERLGVSGTAETLCIPDGAIDHPEASICEVTTDVYDILFNKELYGTEDHNDEEIEDTRTNKCRRTTPILLQCFEDKDFIKEEFIEGYMPDGTSFSEEMDLDDKITQSAGF